MYCQPFFDGALLSLDTMFDRLGWLLSITAHPAKTETSVTEANFFLPLLGLYGKWVQVLSISVTKKAEEETRLSLHNFPGMLQISYWLDVKTKTDEKTKTDGLWTLLGSTPGPGTAHPTQEITDNLKELAAKLAETKRKEELAKERKLRNTNKQDKLKEGIANEKKGEQTNKKSQKKEKIPRSTPRSHHIIRTRQERLLFLGFPPTNDELKLDDSAKLADANKDGAEGTTGFGRCAETFFYIWAGTFM
jgi:hypothetical protein